MGRKFIVLEQALIFSAILSALQVLPGALPAAYAGGALPEGRKTVTLVSPAGTELGSVAALPILRVREDQVEDPR